MKRNEVNKEKLSPMMKQYMEIKDNYEDELLFFRLGDFYELFFEDGEIASRELELTLTGKNAGLDERIPMCGVPHHSVKPYLEALVNKGYKVAIAEQLEDPKNAKGTVKRGVVSVVSKATLVDLDFLKSYDSNYIASLLVFNDSYLLTYSDISTGNIFIQTIAKENEKLFNELLRLSIKEIVVNSDFDLETLNIIENQYGICISNNDDFLENEYEYLYNNLVNLRYKQGVKHLLYYLVKKQLKDLSHIKNVEVIDNNEYLNMDIHTIRNLELFETLRLKERNNSLISLIDKTKTAMGSRKLKNWMLNPLLDIKRINFRYDLIEKINNEFILREKLQNALYEVYDLERLCGKVSCGSLTARDLLQIKKSLAVIPEIKNIVDKLDIGMKIDTHEELYKLLCDALYENPPLSLKEGFLIKEGYNKELDELKSIRSGGKEFISSLEASEKEKTGIKTLKVGYNKVFGYYIEVSKGQTKLVNPQWGWERRQTLADKERYITPILKEKEALVLNSEEKIIELEYNMFLEIKEKVKTFISSLQVLSDSISELDAILSLAIVSEEYGFVRPKINTKQNICIRKAFHPVVKKVNKNEYVANDCIMDSNTSTLLITGPNMSGKSTYMRQLAVIIILAQMGSFVPCESCDIPIFDKIFTRIGASDDLVGGESTFMVEMLEAKNAIINSTANSLILFDELGRGTSTYDGMALAFSILEFVSQKIKCKVLFSTHYHELTKLTEKYENIKNIHVSAIEKDDNITFLHKVEDGPTDKSYGISVANLAGMPSIIIKRAKEILTNYENKSNNKNNYIEYTLPLNDNNNNNVYQELNEYLNKIDVLNITPIEALNELYKIKEMSDRIEK